MCPGRAQYLVRATRKCILTGEAESCAFRAPEESENRAAGLGKAGTERGRGGARMRPDRKIHEAFGDGTSSAIAKHSHSQR